MRSRTVFVRRHTCKGFATASVLPSKLACEVCTDEAPAAFGHTLARKRTFARFTGDEQQVLTLFEDDGWALPASVFEERVAAGAPCSMRRNSCFHKGTGARCSHILKTMSRTASGKQSNTKVCVGVSGGVDSSVAAALLKQQGYDVTGVFVKIWDPELSACDWRAEMQDAMRVCAHLDIPFQMVDLSDVYRRDVIAYMIDAYERGLTPNPDVMCNRVIKFGALFSWAMDAGFDYVATGHYASITASGELVAAVDAAKDQSYFLWNVPKERLSKTLLPLGAHTKPAVRALAKQFGLPTATKPDSQGLCFIGDVDVKVFLAKRVTAVPGSVLNTDGAVIGTHSGARLYTLGERHGFNIHTRDTARKPYYVIERDVSANTITVSQTPRVDATMSTVQLSLCNWLAVDLQEDERLDAVLRYHGERYPVLLHQSADTVTATATFTEPVPRIALGQSVVFYRGAQCVGGGTAQMVS